jgi:uncharacterized membrane protein
MASELIGRGSGRGMVLAGAIALIFVFSALAPMVSAGGSRVAPAEELPAQPAANVLSPAADSESRFVWAPDVTGQETGGDSAIKPVTQSSALTPLENFQSNQANSVFESSTGSQSSMGRRQAAQSQVEKIPGEYLSGRDSSRARQSNSQASSEQSGHQATGQGSSSTTSGYPVTTPTVLPPSPLSNAYVSSILLLCADGDNGEPLHTELEAYTDIGIVEYYDASIATPALSEILSYDVVVCWGNNAFADRNATGDVLADYVDAGGKVILTVFDWAGPTPWSLGGRLMTGGYTPLITNNTDNRYADANLSWFDSAHPIMAGVTNATDNYRDYTTLAAGAQLLASWDDGENYVAVKGSVVAINSYLGTSRVATGDGPLICHNAATFLMSSAKLRIFWYDDFEEDSFSGSVREYLKAQGYYVTYQADSSGLYDAVALIPSYDIIVAEHTCGGGTIYNLDQWFAAGKGYVAMLGSGMYNDPPEDDYIMNLLGIGTDGNSGSGWNPNELTWTPPGNSMGSFPNPGVDITAIPYGQDQYYVDIINGTTVINTTAGAVMQTLEYVEGAGRIVYWGSNYHDADRGDANVRQLIENMIVWAAPSGIIIGMSQTKETVVDTVVQYNLTVGNFQWFNDTIDLTVGSAPQNWTVDLYFDDGVTPLADTDGDMIVDVGNLSTNTTINIVASVTVPPTALVGEFDLAILNATSSWNASVYGNAALNTSVVSPYRFTLLPSAQIGAGYQGENVDYTLSIENRGIFDNNTYDLSAAGNVWPVSFWTSPKNILVNEQFEGSFPPSGWVVNDWEGWGDIEATWHRNDYTGYWNTAGTGNCAEVNSDDWSDYSFGGGGVDSSLYTPTFSLEGFTSATLEFDMSYFDVNWGADDYVEVWVNYGGLWDQLALYDEDHGTVAGERMTFDLTSYVGQTDVFVEFYYYDNWVWADWFQIDNVLVWGDDGSTSAPITSVGPIEMGEKANFIARVGIPNGTAYGSFDVATVVATSQADPSIFENATLNTTCGVIPTNVAIFQDADPWGTTCIQDILTDWGIPFTVYGSMDIWNVNIAPFDKIIIPSDQPQTFYDVVESNLNWFEMYVKGGGILQFSAADNGWNSGIWTNLPGGYLKSGISDDAVDILIPEHQFVTLPSVITDGELDGWSSSTHTAFTQLPPGAVTVCSDSNGPCLVESASGFGRYYATGMTLEYGWSNGNSPILENIVLAMGGTAIEPPYFTRITPGNQLTFGSPGEIVDYVLTIENQGTNVDTFNISVAGNAWPTDIFGYAPTADQLANPSFETGDLSGWDITDLGAPYIPVNVDIYGNRCPDMTGAFATHPTDGYYSLQTGFDGNGPGDILAGQDFAVPVGNPYMVFNYRASWDMTYGATQARTFSVNVEPSGGGIPLFSQVLMTAEPSTTVYDTGVQMGVVDLSAFAGTTVYIEFDWWVPESGTGPALFELDNIQIVEMVAISQIGPIPPGDIVPFVARVSIPPTANLGEFDVALINATSQGDPAIMGSGFIRTQVMAPILLVDDDGGLGCEEYFEDSLGDIGVPYVYWDVSVFGCPSYGFMAPFDAVVWTTGDNSGYTVTIGAPGDTLDNEELTELAMYLDNGGRLYLSSAGFAFDSVVNYDTSWMNYYLGSEPFGYATGTSFTLDGTAGDPVGDGMTLGFHSGDYWPELSGLIMGVDPTTPSAVPPFTLMGDCVSMRLPTLTYRTVYTAFDFSDIEDRPNRALLMERILDWLLLVDSVAVTPETQEYAEESNMTIAYTVDVTNMMSMPDTFDLAILNVPSWPTRIMDATASVNITQTNYLNYGETFTFTIVVDIPVTALPSEWDGVMVNVSSTNNPSVFAHTQAITFCYVTPTAVDDFEGSYVDFRATEAGNVTTVWEIGDPSAFGDGPGGAYSPSNCWGTNRLDYYYPMADSRLQSHYYNLSDAGEANLTFSHWYNTSLLDGGFVEITADYGQTWNIINPVGGYNTQNFWGIDSFGGATGGWVNETFDLNAYLGGTVGFRLRFMSGSASPNPAGWYVDDFAVNAVYPARGCLMTPLYMMDVGAIGANLDYLLTIKNIGTAGPDWFNLTSSSTYGWTVELYDAGMNPVSMVGPLDTGASVDIIARVLIPGAAVPGLTENTWVRAISQNDSMGMDSSLLYSVVFAPIMVVDDDLGIDTESSYMSALFGESYAYNYYDVEMFGAPTLADMLNYQAVIWFTGNSYGVNGESLDAANRLAIEQYLTLGGNVYLSGSMIQINAADAGWRDWLAEWFGAAAVNTSFGAEGVSWGSLDNYTQNILGIAGDPIGDGLDIPLNDAGANANIWPYFMLTNAANPQASVAMNYAPGLAGGDVGAIIRVDAGTFRTAFSSFDFSVIGNLTNRVTLMDEIVSYLVTRQPAISNVMVDGLATVMVNSGTTVTLNATITTVPMWRWAVSGANYTIGAGNWPGTPMDAVDGAFDNTAENVTAIIDTTGWADGSYDLYVYGWDEVSNYNTDSALFATIIIDNKAPISNVIQTGSYWRSANPDVINVNAIDAFNLVNENFDSGVWPPAGWNTGGICSASQASNVLLTHYWSMMDDSGMPLTYSSPYCAGLWWSDGSGGDPADGQQNEWLVSPSMDFSAFTAVDLNFMSAYTMMRYGAAATSHDYIRVSTDGGMTWDVVADLAQDPEFDFDGCTGGPAGASSWNWYEVPISIDLSAYAGMADVMVAWNYLSEAPTGIRGIWMIDDVQVLGDGKAETPSGLASVELYYRYSNDNSTFGAWTYYDALFSAPWDFSFNWPDGEGYYEFYTIATDNVGNVEAAPLVFDATYSYETSIPTSNAVQTSPYLIFGDGLTIAASASNGLSGVREVELWYRTSLDNATWTSWMSYGIDSALPWQWDFVAEMDGYYEFYTVATDFAGNVEAAPGVADAAWAFDVGGPVSNAIQGPAYIVNTSPFTIDADAMDMSPVYLVNEQFEGSFPPAGWAVIDIAGTGATWDRNDAWGNDNLAGTGFCADADSDAAGMTAMDTGLITPTFSLAGYTTASLEFDMSLWMYSGAEYAEVLVSDDSWTTQSQIAYYDTDIPDYSHVVLDLSAFLGAPTVNVMFHYGNAYFDWFWMVDNVEITALGGPAEVNLYHRYSWDNITWGSWMHMYSDNATPWQFNFSWPDGGGYYEFYTTAVDEWGWEEAAPAVADASYYYDIFSPTVVSTSPHDGAANVPPVAGTFRIHFNEKMDTGTGTAASDLPGIAWTWSPDGMWYNGTYTGLAFTTGYYVDLTGGGFFDWVGNFLSGADLNFTFTTASADWASASGPASSGAVNPMPNITYNFGGAVGAGVVDIYYTSNGGVNWSLWGQDATVDGTWTPSGPLPGDGTYYWNVVAFSYEPNPTNPTFIEAGPYVLDTAAPSSSVDAITPYWHNAPILLTATASDATSGVAQVDFYYAFSGDNSTWSVASLIGSDTTFPYSMAFAWPDGDGDYMFFSVATDRAGNLEGIPGTADTNAGYHATAPTATVWPFAQYWWSASPITVNATVMSMMPISFTELVYWYSADSITYGGATVFGTDMAAPWSWSFNFPNGTGHYRFAARAQDTLGNVPAWPPASYDEEVGYDNLKPASAIVNEPPYMRTAPSITINATATDYGPSGLANVGLWYIFSSDNISWGSDTWYAWDAAAPWQFTFNWPDGVGYYRFFTRAQDAAINTEDIPAVADMELWWNPPSPISSVDQYTPYWLDSNVLITSTVIVTGNPVAYCELWYRYSLNNATWGAWTNLSADATAPYSWVFTWPTGQGYYEFYSRSCDILGNYEPAPVTRDSANAYDSMAPSSSVSFEAPYWRTTSPISLNATVGADLSGIDWVDFNFRYSADNVTWGGWGFFAMDMVAPYQATFAWPSGDGFYQFVSQAYDFATNIETLPASGDAAYVYDVTAPTSSVNAISPYWRNAATTITVTASDATIGITSVDLYYRFAADNATWGAWTYFGTDNTAPYQYNFNAPNGEVYYQFYSVATDAAGNAELAPVTADARCAYDTTRPVTAADIAGAYWRSTSPVTITATGSDALSGLYYVDLWVRYSADNVTWGAWTAALTDMTAPYSFSFAFGADGYYEFQTRGVDRADNQELIKTVEVGYGYDATNPTSSVNAIAPYWRIASPITVTVTASDATTGVAGVNLYCRFSADNATWGAWTQFGLTDLTAPYQWSFNFPDGDGHYQFYSVAVDRVSNWEVAAVTADTICGYDTTAPTSSTTSTIPDYWRSAGFIGMTASASDATSGVSRVDLYYRYSTDNSTWGAWTFVSSDFTAPYSWLIPYANGDGFYEYYTRAVDNATNTEAAPGSADFRVCSDMTAPTSSLNAITPYLGAVNPITITATASDASSGINSVTLQYRYSTDNSTWGGWTSSDSDDSAPYQFSFFFTSGSGYYQFRSIAVDNALNMEVAPAAADARCCFDNVAPTSTAALIGIYATYDTTRTVNATASDATSGLAQVGLYYRFSANNATWSPWMLISNLTAAPWSWTGSPTNGTGYYEFYTIATDRAGNVEPAPAGADARFRRLTDTTPPTSTVTYAGPYWRTASPMTINATASDAETSVAYVELWYRFSADNSTWGSWTNFSADAATPYQWTFTFPSGQGFYQFYTRAKDVHGNYEAAPASADALWAYDATPPAVTVAALPAYVTTSTFNISGTVTDAGGMAYVLLYYTTDGGTTWTALPTQYAVATIQFTASADGEYGFYMVAYDLAGNHRAAPTAATAPDTTTLVDTTHPTVTGSTPSGNNVNISADVTVTFSEPMDTTSVEASLTFSQTMTATYTWNAQNTTLTIHPASPMPYLAWVNVTVGTGATDIHGLALASAYTVTFRTAASPIVPIQYGSVGGQVVDKDGNPIQGVTVTLGTTGRTATTDATGHYSFANVTAGTYTLEFSCTGFQPTNVDATVAAGQPAVADAILNTHTGGGGSDYWWIIIVIIVVMVVFLLLWMILKRKKPEADEPKAPKPEEPAADAKQPEGGAQQ